jgi:hydrogenase-4 component E
VNALVDVGELGAVIFLASTLMILATRFFISQLLAYQVQSLVLALFTAAAALLEHHPELYLAAAVTLLVRALAVPWMLRRFAEALPSRREERLILGNPSSVLIGALLIGFAILAAARLLPSGSPLVLSSFATGLALVLLGFFLTSSRPEAFPQVLGLLVIENGLFLLAVGLIPGFPLFNEVVVLFDLLILVVVVGLLARVMVERMGDAAAWSRELRG